MYKFKHAHIEVNETVLKYIIICIAALIINGCDRAIPLQGFRPDMLVENYTTTNFKEDKIEWKLKAKKASYYYKEKKSIAEKIVLNYFKNNKESAIVNADSAVINTETKDIDLIGNVDMISTTGNRLQTAKIRWNNKDGSLNTDEHVKIARRNGDIIEGIGLRADYNLENYEIKKRVSAVSKNINSAKLKKK
ncbi:MAG: LPS export ABC transporter periplasmic protein LptC [Spirochaetota bacterium]